MRIAFLPAARRDALRQYRYLTEEAGPEVATRFLDALEGAVTRISRHPSAGSRVTTGHPELVGVRAVRVEGFPLVRVYYYLQNGSEIRVMRVLHARRDVGPLLRRARLG
jgi:toxin ParE1/3/4